MLRTAIGDATGRMRSLNTLGLTQLRSRQFEAAAENFVRAREEGDRLDAIDFRVASRVNLAIMFNGTGRHREAETAAREALDLLDSGRHIALLADAKQELGRALRGQDRLADAAGSGDRRARCPGRSRR